MDNRRCAVIVSNLLLTALLAQVPGTADAQAADTAPNASQDALDEVVITGSRIQRQDYEANSPFTSISADVLQSVGAVTIESALNQLPQFGIGANVTNAGFGGTGQANLNLRGLGPTRNLVLLDGRRLQPSDVLGWVDINTIPPSLIGNVEIISGGASAVYGSDALAGVVNLQTRKHFNGVEVSARYDRFDAGDGAALDTSITAGGDFAGDRGNAVISLSYLDRQKVDYMARDFFRAAQGGTDFRLPTGIFRPSVNPPSQAAVDAVFARYGAAPGRVPRTAVLGYNDDGTLFAASNGPFNYRGPAGLLFNTGTQLNNLNLFSLLQVPLTRYSVFGQAHYAVTDDVELFAQLYYTTYDSYVNAEAGNDAFNVPVTNPFIPADLRTILASRANPTAPFRFEKRFTSEAGSRDFDRTFDVYQLTTGARGRLQAIDGTWEIFGSHGDTKKIERNQGSVLISSLTALLNAPDGGTGLCQGGYNPFGLSVLSQDCRNFLVATPISQTDLQQDSLEATVQGRVLTLPSSEDLRFAAGLGYRRQAYEYLPDHDLARGNVVGVFRTGESRGSSNVKEAYVELLVPLLRDRALAQSLDLDLAYRRSDYNLAGGVDTYKADLSWRIVDPVRIRGGYQRAVRAPSVGELFVAPNVSIPGIGTVASGSGDFCNINSVARTGANAAAARALCVAQGVAPSLVDTFDNQQQEVLATSSGNTALGAETGDTYTLGAVWRSPLQSPLLSDLSVSLDYYRIKIRDVIGTIGAAQILPKCFNRDGSNPTLAADNYYCALISRDAITGLITNVNQPTLNLGGYRTAGYDLQLDWAAGLGALGLDDRFGTLSVNSVVSYLDSFKVKLQKTSAELEYAGSVGAPSSTLPGSLPQWKAVTRLQWARGDVAAGLRWRYIGGMQSTAKVTNAASTVPDVGGYSYFDLYGSWKTSERLSVDGGINNVTDKGPPIVGTTLGSTERSTYDIYGRQYFVGVKFKF
jgi:outer membrane receptor protein involved in Fe transport